MTPTRIRLLLALAVLATAFGWALTRAIDAFATASLPVPWSAPIVMAVLALTLVLWTRGTRDRLARKPGTKPMEPLVAARSAALAMAASRTGAVVAGLYTGIALGLAPSWGIAYAQQRVLVCVATVVASVLVVLAGLWLERVCRIPPDSSDDTNV
jgi:hypothetical protein